MARSLDGDWLGRPADDGDDRRRIDRSAARAFAAAVSSLLIASLVISQSAEALDPEGTVAGNDLAGGTITLVDDDGGRSLVELDDMAPGRPSTQCIAVGYEGTILPVDMTLAAVSDGPLAAYLEVEVEAGSGGGFEDCGGFTAEETVYDGTVAALAAGEPIPVGRFRNQGDRQSFRFTFELADDGRAMGQASSVDFLWEATP